MSAHADSKEILRWLGTCTRPPERTFLVHGELVAQHALKQTIEQTLGWTVQIPDHGETVEVDL